jgi:septum formation topological specificity factor MinE
MIYTMQAQQQLSIGILADMRTPQSDGYLIQLKKDISSVVGKGYQVNFMDVRYSEKSLQDAEENYQQLLKNDVDIIIAFGVVNTIMLNKETEFTKPTIIIGAVNNDFVNLPEGKTTSGIHNLTYLIVPFSFKEALEAFSSIYDYKKVGIIVDDYLVNLLPIRKQFDDYFANLDAHYRLIPISNENIS